MGARRITGVRRITGARRVIGALGLALAVLSGGAAAVAGPAGADASAPLNPFGWREVAVGVDNGFYTTWSGTIPAGAGGACALADPRCDHTLLEVRQFEGLIPCVGVAASSTGGAVHVAVYRLTPGLGAGELVATSDDGTLLFIGEAGATYDVAVGRPGLDRLGHTDGYTVAVGTKDIGLGPGVGPGGDLLLCAPGVWAADTLRARLTGGTPTLPPVTVPPVPPVTVPPVTIPPLPPVTLPPVPPVGGLVDEVEERVEAARQEVNRLLGDVTAFVGRLVDDLLALVEALRPDPVAFPNPGWPLVAVSSYHEFGGTVPAGSTGACVPASPRCDHTLIRIDRFNGTYPCVGIRSVYADGAGGPTHVMVTRWSATAGIGEVVASSDSGELLFYGELGATYVVSVGESGPVPLTAARPYIAAVGTLDVGFRCVPGTWAAGVVTGRLS